MKLHRNLFLISFLLILVIVVAGYWLSNRGYGEVSPATYELSKALYSACLKQSSEHLTRIEDKLEDSDELSLPPKERQWLERIIAQARNGNWNSAARMAKRMMEDQVEY